MNGRTRSAIDLFATIAMAAAAVLLIWRYWETPQRPNRAHSEVVQDLRTSGLVTTLPIAHAGSERARVAVVEFSDFECPFCGRHSRETLPEIERAFIGTGKVLYGFRHLPMPNHAHARSASRAAECAASQGRFWPMHDLLFANQAKLGQAFWRTAASVIGLDLNLFESCLAADSPSTIAADLAEARRLGAMGTPTFVIGTRGQEDTVHITAMIRGAYPYEVFRDALTTALASE